MLWGKDFRKILSESFNVGFINESEGLTNRKEGDPFANSAGDIITFIKMEEFSNDDPNLLQSEIKNWVESSGISEEELVFTNKISSSTKAARAAIFINQDETRSRKVFIRYFNNLGSKWSSGQFAKDTGFRLHTKAGKGEHLPLKPTDIIKTEDELSSEQLFNLIMTNTDGLKVDESVKNDIRSLVSNFWNRTEEWTDVGADAEEKRSNYTKYLGEIVAPLAITTGYKVSGDYEKSQTYLLEGLDITYSDMKIKFPMSTSNALEDSILVYGDYEVKISSKAKSGGGAAASSSTLFSGVQRLDDDFINENKKIIEIIRMIDKYQIATGVPYIGVHLGLITPEEKEYIIQRIKNRHEGSIKVPEQYENLYRLTQKWKSDYKDNYKDGFHMHLAVGKEIAEVVNSTPEFDTVARTILTNASLIQVYCSIEKKGNLLRFKDFFVKYPPVFTGTIVLDASKNSSSRMSNKIGFKFK